MTAPGGAIRSMGGAKLVMVPAALERLRTAVKLSWPTFLAPPVGRLTLGLRTKITVVVVGPGVLLGLVTAVYNHLHLSQVYSDELTKRGIATARDLAARSSVPLLTNNLYGIYELAMDTLKNSEDVRYILIHGSQGEVLVHTFGRSLPRGLAEANAVAPEESDHVELLDTGEAVIRDVAVPILGGTGTARVGVSERC